MRYFIEPTAELHGEGNGWDAVPESEAVQFVVIEIDDHDNEETIDSFDTRAAAEALIAELTAQEQ